MSKLILINLSNTLKNELLQRKLIFTCLDVCIHVILLSILSSSLLTLLPIFIYMLCQTKSNWVSQTNRSSKKVTLLSAVWVGRSSHVFFMYWWPVFRTAFSHVLQNYLFIFSQTNMWAPSEWKPFLFSFPSLAYSSHHIIHDM